MTHLALIISNLDKALAFEWIAQNIDKQKFTPCFILLNPGESFLEDWLKAHHFTVYRITYNGKYSLPWAVIRVFFILAKENISVVHCHLFDAGIVGLLAARLAGVGKRIYTRHHAMMSHVYYPKAVAYDQWINSMATHLIAPSQVVLNTLVQKEKVHPKKISLIHHGFDLELFANPDQEVVAKVRAKYNLQNRSPVIGIIARYAHLKGIQFVIPAYQKILKLYPNALLMLANAQGDYASEIKKMLTKLPSDSYREINFENENAALYHLFDMHIHVPIAKDIEAFGQTYVEALAGGVPSIFTLSGVANEFIVNEKNALVVDFEKSDQIYEAMLKLLKENGLKEKLVAQGKEDVKELFGLDKMIGRLEKLYS